MWEFDQCIKNNNIGPCVVGLIKIYDDDSDKMNICGVTIIYEYKVGEEVGPTSVKPQLGGIRYRSIFLGVLNN